jgi:hypothetical protein
MTRLSMHGFHHRPFLNRAHNAYVLDAATTARDTMYAMYNDV